MPVTTQDRIAQFEEITAKIHSVLSEPIVTTFDVYAGVFAAQLVSICVTAKAKNLDDDQLQVVEKVEAHTHQIMRLLGLNMEAIKDAAVVNQSFNDYLTGGAPT